MSNKEKKISHVYTYPDEKHRWYVPHTYSLLKNIFGPIVRLVWIKKTEGVENIPLTGPVIIAFNHQSYFDFLCFIAVCPRQIYYLSAEKFFSNPFWKPIMKLSGQIKVYREEHDKKKLNTTIHDHLKEGHVIGIFPEGTRAAHPVEMLHAFTGVAKYAINGEVPVIPIGIRGTHSVMSRHDRLPKFKKIVSFHVGQPVHFKQYYGKTISEKEYRDATDQIMLEISALSKKTYLHVGKMERDPKPEKS